MSAEESVERIPAALAGERLDRLVALLLGCPRSEAGRLVDGGHVRVDGEVCTVRSRRLSEGDEVRVPALEPEGATVPQPDVEVDLDVVHEDSDVIVLDKAAGVVVHPGAGQPHHTLVSGLLARFPEIASVGEPERPGIVHRLDRDTSGLLVVARSERAREGLVAQLAARTVERRYDALVWGHLATPSGMIEAPIGRSVRHPTRMAVTARGREARTSYEVVVTFDDPVDASRLACRLHTGRTHQIRVHLAAIGHPVVGDRLYGGVRPTLDVPRQWLHAAVLGFDHPVTGQAMRFESPLPADLVVPLGGLGFRPPR